MKLKTITASWLLSATLAASATPFDDALATLLANNLAPRAEQLRAQAGIETMKADNQLPPPEAEFSRVWGSNAEVGNKWALSISQGFDWPGIYSARREAVRKARTASQYLYESTLLEARAEARQLLIDAIHNAQLLDMQTELAGYVDAMVEIYRKGAEEGTETRLDYNKTVLERIAVHRELHALEAQQAELVAQITAFNGGLDPGPILAMAGKEYPAALALPSAPTADMLRQRDPAYAAAMAQSEAARSLVKVENRSRFPGFSIGYEHETELGGNFDGFSIGITLPTFTRKHQAKAAALEAEAALIDAEMQLAKVSATMSGDLRRLTALREVIEEYEPVINDPSNIQLLRKAFEAGQITYLTFIEESNYFISARRDYIDILWEYHTLLANLAKYE